MILQVCKVSHREYGSKARLSIYNKYTIPVVNMIRKTKTRRTESSVKNHASRFAPKLRPGTIAPSPPSAVAVVLRIRHPGKQRSPPGG